MKRHNAPHSTGKEKKKEEEEKKGGRKKKKRKEEQPTRYHSRSLAGVSVNSDRWFFSSFLEPVSAPRLPQISTCPLITRLLRADSFVIIAISRECTHAALSLISFFQTIFKSVSKSLNEDLVFERVAQME